MVLALVGYFTLGRPIQVLPRMQAAVPFEMSDQDGDAYRYPDEARPINVYVVAASWDEAALQRAEHLLQLVYDYASEQRFDDLLEIAWITPDPQNDDIYALQSLARALPILRTTGASLLTASPVAVRMSVGAGFGIFIGSPSSDGARLSYEPALAIVDDVGWVRGRYGLQTVDEQRLLRDISLLAAEARAEGAEKTLYQAAHLFLCYPR